MDIIIDKNLTKVESFSLEFIMLNVYGNGFE